MIYIYNSKSKAEFKVSSPITMEKGFSHIFHSNYYTFTFKNNYGIDVAFVINKFDDRKRIRIGDTFFDYDAIDKNPDYIKALIEQENIKDSLEILP